MRRRSTSSWWLGRIMGFVYVRKWDVEERGAVFREKSTDKGCFLFFLLFHGLTRNARWASHRISRIHQKRYLLACKPLKPPSSPWSPNETTTLAEGDDVDYTQFQVLFLCSYCNITNKSSDMKRSKRRKNSPIKRHYVTASYPRVIFLELSWAGPINLNLITKLTSQKESNSITSLGVVSR